MKLKSFILFLLVFLCFESCQSTYDLAPSNETKNMSLNQDGNDPVPIPDDDILAQNFNTAVNNYNGTLADLLTEDTTIPAYRDLKNASIEILQKMNLLDTLKSSLNITNDSDPRLIIAAKLMNDFYVSINLVIEEGASPILLKCIVVAIGIPYDAINSLLNGDLHHAGMEFLGEAVHEYAEDILERVVLQLGLSLTPLKYVLMVVDFTACIVKNSEPLPPNIEEISTLSQDIPGAFFNPDGEYLNHIKPDIITYLIDMYNMDTEQANSIIMSAYYSQMALNGLDTAAINYVGGYFKQYENIGFLYDSAYIRMTFTIGEFNMYIGEVQTNTLPSPGYWNKNDIISAIDNFHGSVKENQAPAEIKHLGDSEGFILQLQYYVNHYYFTIGGATQFGTPGPVDNPNAIPEEGSSPNEPIPED